MAVLNMCVISSRGSALADYGSLTVIHAFMGWLPYIIKVVIRKTMLRAVTSFRLTRKHTSTPSLACLAIYFGIRPHIYPLFLLNMQEVWEDLARQEDNVTPWRERRLLGQGGGTQDPTKITRRHVTLHCSYCEEPDHLICTCPDFCDELHEKSRLAKARKTAASAGAGPSNTASGSSSRPSGKAKGTGRATRAGTSRDPSDIQSENQQEQVQVPVEENTNTYIPAQGPSNASNVQNRKMKLKSRWLLKKTISPPAHGSWTFNQLANARVGTSKHQKTPAI